MSQEKLTLKQILACIDHNYKNAWKEFTPEERKSVGFWLLNRYVSALSGPKFKQENAVLKTNEFYNKNFNDIGVGQNGHPELMWQLLCTSGATGRAEFHPWIGFKKKTSDSKAIKLLEEIYPELKQDEVELLAKLYTKKELRQLAEDHGIENYKP